jgi:hypothetical protein
MVPPKQLLEAKTARLAAIPGSQRANKGPSIWPKKGPSIWLALLQIVDQHKCLCAGRFRGLPAIGRD